MNLAVLAPWSEGGPGGTFIKENHMAENVKIDLEDNSKYRVALDLAFRIAHAEQKTTTGDREYWLKLYSQCRQVVIDARNADYAQKMS